MKTTQCFAVTSYCNTPPKLLALHKTLDNLKQYGLDIFIHAHYPLSVEIQQKVHSYFYSSDNPVLYNRWNAFWWFADQYKMELRLYDTYYTTLKGWSESIKICSDYEKIHMVNYDSNIYPELMNISANHHNKSIVLSFIENNTHCNDLLYFCLKKDSYEYFRENITLPKYANFDNKVNPNFYPTIEEFMGSFTQTENFHHIFDHDKKKLLEYNINEHDKLDWKKIIPIPDANLFIGEYDDNVCLLFSEVKNHLDILVKSLDNDNKSFHTLVDSTKLIPLHLTFDQIKQTEIQINGHPIDTQAIDKFANLHAKIYLL